MMNGQSMHKQQLYSHIKHGQTPHTQSNLEALSECFRTVIPDFVISKVQRLQCRVCLPNAARQRQQNQSFEHGSYSSKPMLNLIEMLHARPKQKLTTHTLQSYVLRDQPTLHASNGQSKPTFNASPSAKTTSLLS